MRQVNLNTTLRNKLRNDRSRNKTTAGLRCVTPDLESGSGPGMAPKSGVTVAFRTQPMKLELHYSRNKRATDEQRRDDVSRSVSV